MLFASFTVLVLLVRDVKMFVDSIFHYTLYKTSPHRAMHTISRLQIHPISQNAFIIIHPEFLSPIAIKAPP